MDNKTVVVPVEIIEHIKTAEGCFEAAHIEGLHEALEETTDARLKDLVTRRLLWASQSLATALEMISAAPQAEQPQAQDERKRKPTGDEIRAIVRSVRGSSNEPQSTEYVFAGWMAALAQKKEASAQEQHYDDYAVDCFAQMMKEKLRYSREVKGRGGWNDPSKCSAEYLQKLFHEHVQKGDPVDVANLCMMLAHYRAITTPSFDVWQANPYTKVLQKSIAEDYVPKPEASAGQEAQERKPWDYCPECGSTESEEPRNGMGHFCVKCGQEWFGHIDYSEVVRKNLERLAGGNSLTTAQPADKPEGKPSPL